MKVRNLMNHYSMASNARVFVENRGKRREIARDSLRDIEWNEDSMLDLTVGMIKVIDNDLIITVY